MRKLATRSVVGALLLVLAGAFVAPASAAPSKVSSSPSDGEELHEAPERVTIEFDQPLDPESSIEVTNHCDERVDEPPTEVNGTEMSVAVTGNWAGMYHVTYIAKGVGGLTGEQKGSFTFSVHAGDPCDGSGGHHHGGGNGGHEGSGHEGSGHEGSGEHGSGGHSTGGHVSGDDGAHATGTHESAAHRGTTHAMSGTHSATGGHEGMDHGTHSGGGHGDHGAHRAASKPDATRHITSAPSGDLRGPGKEAVVWSLGLCALLGVLGGAVLRFSAPN